MFFYNIKDLSILISISVYINMNCKSCCLAMNCSPLGTIRRYSKRTKNRKVVLLLVGLDNAGKSCAAKRLAREPVNMVVPTVGFNSIKLKHRGFTVILYDLGGSMQIRGIWPRYYADVHGVIFVVDASDLNRIDESRKVLEELLAHDKLTGKPLLLLANKQDKEGALDEIDIVERLGLEVLVNQQKCPTLVETCSAAGPPTGDRAKMDPGIQNGYRWILQRIISSYDSLNNRVEQDSEEQKTGEKAARAEWLQRRETEHQVDSLPSEFEGDGDPFRPIHSLLVRQQNGHVSNGHAVQVDSLTASVTEDTPDSCSLAMGEGSDRGDAQFIPLHSPTKLQQSDIDEPNMKIVSEPLPYSVLTAVREQFEWKMLKQKRRKFHLKRSNRTAPASAESENEERKLPPLRLGNSCSWARPTTAQSLPSHGWGLQMSLEEVNPPSFGTPKTLEIVQSPRTLNTTDSDDDDVVCFS